ncbi:MAG: S8 family serine peptidase [Candidatus Omnitrophota bacterium]
MKTYKYTFLKVVLSAILFVAALLTLVCAAEQVQKTRDTAYAPGQVIVKLKEYKEKAGAVSIQGAALGAGQYAETLSRIKGQYKLKDEHPVFKAVPSSQIKAQNSSQQNSEVKPLEQQPYYLFKTDEDVLGTCGQLNKDADVEYAEPNYLFYPSYIPNDPSYNLQWAHQRTHAEAGWDIQQGNPAVTIAIIDTGVAYNHEDLQANIWRDSEGNPGRDFVDIDVQAYINDAWEPIPEEDYVGIDNDPSDYFGHGTHCAGIAAATGDNNIGIAGTAFKCKIMPVRTGFEIIDVYHGAHTHTALLESDDTANGIYYAADNGANVISMSFGGSGQSQTIKAALDYAYGKGVVLVAAAGNSGLDIISYPGGYENVIGVAATAIDDTKAYYSSFGEWVDIAAPGGDDDKDSMIFSTVPTVGGTLSDPSGYLAIQGTSMACPYVAGVAALLRAANPGWTNAQVQTQLINTADSLVGIDKAYGNKLGSGLVNIYKALTTAPEPKLVISGYTKSDSGQDGLIDPGETINVTITLKNNWASAKGVTAVLKSSNPYINVIDSTKEYGDIDSLSEATQTFSFYVMPTITRPCAIPLELSVNAAGGYNTKLNLSFKIDPKWSLRPGWPISGAGMIKVADLDGDGKKEIVILDLQSLDVLNADGTRFAGDWPKTRPDPYFLSPLPAIGDIDGDGKKEIIIAERQYRSTDSCKIYAFRSDGSTVEGWPIDTGFKTNMIESPSLADLDQDGRDEVVINVSGHLYVYNGKGGIFNSGWPVTVSNVYFSRTASFADIDDDGNLDIVYGDGDAVHAFNSQGKELPGWPYHGEWSQLYQVCIGDIDNDGSKEVVFSTFGPSRIFVLDKNGQIKNPAQWPVATSIYAIGSLALSDLDNDGDLEILAAGLMSNEVQVFHYDGTLLPGWPVQTERTTSASMAFTNIGGIGDLDGDGYKEVTVLSNAGIYLFKYDGTPMLTQSPFLKEAASRFDGHDLPCIVDIDNDGTTELIGQTYKKIYMWDFPGDIKRADWPFYAHDIRNTCALVNHPPRLIPIENRTITMGKLLEFNIQATDLDKDTLIYKAKNLPRGATLDGQTFRWTPRSACNLPGKYKVTFTVSDGKLSASQQVTITLASSPVYINSISGIFGFPNSGLVIRGRNFGKKDADSKAVFTQCRGSKLVELQADIIRWSDSLIICRIPAPGVCGPYKISVLTKLGESNSRQFYILARYQRR